MITRILTLLKVVVTVVEPKEVTNVYPSGKCHEKVDGACDSLEEFCVRHFAPRFTILIVS